MSALFRKGKDALRGARGIVYSQLPQKCTTFNFTMDLPDLKVACRTPFMKKIDKEAGDISDRAGLGGLNRTPAKGTSQAKHHFYSRPLHEALGEEKRLSKEMSVLLRVSVTNPKQFTTLEKIDQQVLAAYEKKGEIAKLPDKAERLAHYHLCLQKTETLGKEPYDINGAILLTPESQLTVYGLKIKGLSDAEIGVLQSHVLTQSSPHSVVGVPLDPVVGIRLQKSEGGDPEKETNSGEYFGNGVLKYDGPAPAIDSQGRALLPLVLAMRAFEEDHGTGCIRSACADAKVTVKGGSKLYDDLANDKAALENVAKRLTLLTYDFTGKTVGIGIGQNPSDPMVRGVSSELQLEVGTVPPGHGQSLLNAKVKAMVNGKLVEAVLSSAVKPEPSVSMAVGTMPSPDADLQLRSNYISPGILSGYGKSEQKQLNDSDQQSLAEEYQKQLAKKGTVSAPKLGGSI